MESTEVNSETVRLVVNRKDKGGFMSDHVQLEVNDKVPQVSSDQTTEAPQAQKKSTLKGMLMMAICCAAPLLLLAAIPFLGAAFGSLAAAGSGLLSIVALLACPVGMFLMMRMMMKDKKEDQPSRK
jgi:cation transport ATPase